APDVVLARPYRLHRNARGLRDLHRLADEVRRRSGAPSEPSAEELGMDGNVFRRDAGDARRRHLVHGLELGSGPDLAAAVGEAHRAVERLHRRVREVGDVVFSNHALGVMGERFFRISLLRGHGTLALLLRAEALEELRAIDVGARPRIPVDHEGIATELGAPEIARDDSDAGWHLHHLLDALDRPGLARVERLDLPSEDGR